jgi:transcriptional regulator with GAF, ATPase, and Fis domain
VIYFENRYCHKDGTPRWLLWAAAPFMQEQVVYAAARDITERKAVDDLRARTTKLELLDELLDALTDSGDLPDVFGRVSAVAQKVLTHDAAALMVRLGDTHQARLYASTGMPPRLAEITDIPEELLQNPNWEHDILDDLTRLPEPRYAQLVTIGFQSLLRVPLRLENRFAGALVFLSTRRGAFEQMDILAARRMADRMAVAVARDREIQASRRADEASARASKLEARVTALTEELDARTGYRRVVGESAQWRQVLTEATKVELFGYERGAYTGATQSKPGQLEQAAGGTLFLDEVGEMSPSAQAKFLRVLQEREFQRLGGTRVLRADARVVAATNRDLQKGIANGHFREDLYYRLNVFAIRLPALRERPDDILPLSDAFLVEIGRGLGTPPAGISRDARRQLTEYHWPGNVRELRNVLERAAILCDGGLITAEHLSLNIGPALISAAIDRGFATGRASGCRTSRACCRFTPAGRSRGTGPACVCRRSADAGARHYRAGASQRAVQQVESRESAGFDTPPVERADAEVRFRLSADSAD